MTRPRSRLIWPLLALAAAGCGPIVQIGGNSNRPASLYTLSAPPPAAVPSGLKPYRMISDFGRMV